MKTKFKRINVNYPENELWKIKMLQDYMQDNDFYNGGIVTQSDVIREAISRWVAEVEAIKKGMEAYIV